MRTSAPPWAISSLIGRMQRVKLGAFEAELADEAADPVGEALREIAAGRPG